MKLFPRVTFSCRGSNHLKSKILSVVFTILFCGIGIPTGIAAENIEISQGDGPEHEIRFTSGNTTYIEALIEGRWVGRYFSQSKEIDSKNFWTSEAFILTATDNASVDAVPLDLSKGWEWVSSSKLPHTEKNTQELIVELHNKILPLNLKIHTLLDGTAVFTRWLEITNVHDRAIGIMDVSPWAGLLWSTDAPIYLGHSLNKEVGTEGRFTWTLLEPGDNVRRNDTGRLWDDPYFILRNESNEEYFFGQLAWAANYEMGFHKQDGVTFHIGPIAPKTLRVLSPGETTITPSVHMGYTREGFDAAVQSMHTHIRRSVIPERDLSKAYLSQYIVPGDWGICHYVGENFTEENMLKCIDVVAAADLDVFILDGPCWAEGYGNWLVPHRKRFPRGVEPLVQHAHEKGLLFGMYFETEGGRDGDTSANWDAGAPIGLWKDTPVFKEHPEWFDRANLDLTFPGAAAYLENELIRIIEHYKLDLYRHDSNGIVFYPPGPGGGQTLRSRSRFVESDSWRYYEAFNGILSRLQEKYPELILQEASAGGFRLDLGAAAAFHEHFAGDFGGALGTYRNSSGMSVFLPPEVIVMAIGLCHPSALPDLETALRGGYTMGFTPMFFTTMLPATVEQFKSSDQQLYQRYAKLYHSYMRPMLSTLKVYHHAPVNATSGTDEGNWLAMEFASPDQTKGWATVIRLSGSGEPVYTLKLKGVDPERSYQVTLDNSGTKKNVSGKSLMDQGLSLTINMDRASELVLFEAQ